MNSNNPLRKEFPYKFYNVTIILIIINLLIYFINNLFRETYVYMALIPDLVFQKGFFWQVFSYMFVHQISTSIFDVGSHLFFNMFGLFIFGRQLEHRMGSTEFLTFYLTTGLGVGIISLFIGIPIVGASGAIYALLLAFATYFPDAKLLLFFIIPIRATTAVIIFGVIAIVSQISGAQGNIAHLAHLAGLLMGFFYFIIRFGINPVTVFLNNRRLR